MFEGTVVHIHVGPQRRQPMRARAEVKAVPGHGLEGDRYARLDGTFSEKDRPGQQVTLVEAESLEALERDYQIHLEPGATRRNITTRGVPLNHLVGREFLIGEVRMRGIRLCEPCSHLERLCNQDLVKGLRHRGGLRAQILNEGVIRVGDRVTGD
jgi:MOSC domain-containing protein YiiM